MKALNKKNKRVKQQNSKKKVKRYKTICSKLRMTE